MLGTFKDGLALVPGLMENEDIHYISIAIAYLRFHYKIATLYFEAAITTLLSITS